MKCIFSTSDKELKKIVQIRGKTKQIPLKQSLFEKAKYNYSV
jgi:hypothetical protein